MKVCCTCRVDKPVSEFAKNKSTVDGYSRDCKECHRKTRRKYYENNKNREKDNVIRWRRENCDKNHIEVKCGGCGKPLIRHRTTIKSKNSYCSLICRRNSDVAGYINYYYTATEKRSRQTGKAFDLDREYLSDLFFNIQKSKCAVLGVPIRLGRVDDNFGIYELASIDRINNSIGYVKGNIRFVCLGINYMRNRRSDDEMHILLDMIKNNYTGRVYHEGNTHH